MGEPAKIKIIRGKHRAPAVLPKCRCGGEPERMPFCSMNPYYTIKCASCGEYVTEIESQDAEDKWREQNEA